MSIHDTIGDFITVIRNAGLAGKDQCSYPHSNLRAGIAKSSKIEALSGGESDSKNGFKVLDRLKYVSETCNQRYQSDQYGRRSYCGYRDIPSVLGGLGISIISSPKGIIDDKTARKEKLGGELLCSVW